MTTGSAIYRLRDNRGQSLVEFSLVAFMLIIVIFTVVDFCRLILVYTTVANAARGGVRYAIVHGSFSPPSTTVRTIVSNYLGVGTANGSNAAVTVNSPDPAGTSSSGCTSPGCHVSVTVSYPYNPLTKYFPLSVTLASTSQGVITF